MPQAKIQTYKSPLVAVGQIGTTDVLVRIPVNLTPPVPGSTVSVRKHPSTPEVEVLVSTNPDAKNSEKKREKWPLFLFDPEHVDKK
jgi:hypothetical protein